MTDTHGQSAIPQQTGVIGLGHAINLSEDKALEGGDRDVGGERLEGRRPVSLEENGVLVGSRLDGIRHTIWQLLAEAREVYLQSRPGQRFRKPNSAASSREDSIAAIPRYSNTVRRL